VQAMTSKTAGKPTIKLKIESGPVSPAMRRSWVTFWKRLILEVKQSEAVK
jgi:hypothetical protein